MSRSHARSLVAVFAIAALALTACGDDDTTTGAPETASTVALGTFPVVVDAENGAVTIAAEPQRIVSLSPSLTELLYAIDAGDQVAAVDKYSDFPAGTPTTEISGFRPNIEAIGGHEPDLVVLASDRDGIVDALTGLGIPTLLLSSADSLADVYDQIDILGDATGHTQEAVLLAQGMKADIQEIVADVPDRDAALRYFYELSDDYSSVTSDTFIGELLSLAGLQSIADGVDSAAGSYPKLTAEYVIDADPDVIFLAHADGTGLDPAEVGTRPGWAAMQAVVDGDVVVLPTDIASRWGPRVVDLLRAVVEATVG